MTTRIKTITVPFGFDAVADHANNTLTLVGNNTIYIPENNGTTPVVFKDVALFVTHQDLATATGSTLADYDANVCLQGATSQVFTESADLTNSGENVGGLFGPLNFTSHFTSNFGTETSKTCLVSTRFSRSTGTGTGTRGVYAWMDITYQYDDTQPTHIKTICYPVSNVSGALSSTANTSIGVIPQLTGTGGMLCETSPVIRDMWFKIQGNHAINAGTAGTFLSANTGGTTITLPISQSNLATDLYRYYQVNANTVDTSSPFSLRLWSNVATRWHGTMAELWINYEFDAANTTNVLNYIEGGVEFDSPANGTTSANAEIITRTLLIPEPGPILPVRQAFQLYYVASASATPQVKIGSQSAYTGYAMVGSVMGGMHSLQHRFDTGGSGGSGLTLQQGENTLNVSLYRSTAQALYNTSGKIKLLYHSGVSANGIGAHNHVIRYTAKPMVLTLATQNTVNSIFEIGNEYWLDTFGADIFKYCSGSADAVSMRIKQIPGEGDGSWVQVYSDLYINDAELTYSNAVARLRNDFKRHPTDLDSERMNANTTRPYQYSTLVSDALGVQLFGTVSNITYTWEGEIANTQGGNVTIYLCRADNGERMYKTHVTGNGTYIIKTYDNSVQYYADAYESNVSMGRSNTSNAV